MIAMPRGARRGEQVLKRLRERPPAIWYRGEQVKDVTTHPALPFQSVVRWVKMRTRVSVDFCSSCHHGSSVSSSASAGLCSSCAS